MSELRQSAPLLDAYLSYFESKRQPFTIPGHKQRASRLDVGLGAVVDSDIPLYGGLDEIKLSLGVLAKAAWGLSELTFLGALLFRRGLGEVLDTFVSRGDWSASDALAVVKAIGNQNALAAYHLNK